MRSVIRTVLGRYHGEPRAHEFPRGKFPRRQSAKARGTLILRAGTRVTLRRGTD